MREKRNQRVGREGFIYLDLSTTTALGHRDRAVTRMFNTAATGSVLITLQKLLEHPALP